MQKNIFSKGISFFLFLLCFALHNAQNIGDYGAITSGTWNTAIWGVWNGTSFVGPAQTLPSPTTKDVYIPAGITVSTPTTSTTATIGNLYISGTLALNGNFTLSTTKKIIITGGTVLWNTNCNLILSDPNAIITISSGSPGFQGGSICNNNRAVYIGTVRYAVCSGSGNADYLFSDMNAAGGTIASVPAISPTQICQGSSTTLSGSAAGLGSGTATFKWSVVSSPNSYVFPSGFSTTSATPQSIVLSTAGTYIFSLQVSTIAPSGTTYSNTQNVTVIVDPTSVGGTATPNQTICSGSQPANISLSGYTGTIQWQSSTDNINFTDISGATSATLLGSAIGNLTTITYFRAKVTSGTCTSTYSTSVAVSINIPTISGNTVVAVGGTSQLTGSPTAALTNAWISSNPAVATVSSTGLVTGVSQGSTTITYTNNLGCKASINISVGVCFQSPTSPGTGGISSIHGITDLGRAGANNGNWPMIRKGAYTVLEAKTKGFVITRVASTSAIANPIEGMVVYDIANDCLSIYNGTAWKCYKTQTCP